MPPITYKPINPKSSYGIFVSKLPLCEDEYRISLFEEGDPHDTQIFALTCAGPTTAASSSITSDKSPNKPN